MRWSAQSVEFTTFSPEAHLLFLSAHALLKHGQSDFMLRRFLDMHLLIQKTELMNWQMVADQAVTLCWTYTTERMLSITKTLFSTKIPEGLLTELRERRPATEDISRVIRPREARGSLERIVGRLSTLNKCTALRLVSGSLFPTPTYMRWRYGDAVWKLPWYYIYRCLRIILFVTKNVYKKMRRSP